VVRLIVSSQWIRVEKKILFLYHTWERIFPLGFSLNQVMPPRPIELRRPLELGAMG
jgi:hypothetical protein